MSFLQKIFEFLGRVGRSSATVRITDLESLQLFVESRASHVTQTSLYGYLRTRAGSRYPELFANDDFAKAINAAKWNIWLACVSDLTIYAGGLIAKADADGKAATETARVMGAIINGILRAGPPAEASREYPPLAAAVRKRVESCCWDAVPDNEGVFSESPDALVRWAPIVDQLKELDAEIVRNSVRFRWQEVRRDLRQGLDAEALLAGAAPGAAAGVTPGT